MANVLSEPRHKMYPTDHPDFRPWPALWALVLGFFMILVDTTIVSVATPAIMSGLDTDVNDGDLGDQRLPARLRRAAVDHRSARGPVRTRRTSI